MKIVLTGGGSGGHFYPLIAVASELRKIQQEKKIVEMNLFYLSHTPYEQKLLDDHSISFIKVPAGKLRRYLSFENIIDMIKLPFAVIVAFFKLLSIYPDVVFSKGGFPSVPVVFAAKLLNIPIIVHESDTRPGRANMFGARFAQKIALSFPEAVSYFDESKTALVGHIIREELQRPVTEGVYEYLKLDPTIPTIFVIGGSQGAKIINEAILNIITSLVDSYQIIHQTGVQHFEDVKSNTEFLLQDSKNKQRYQVFPYLNALAMRMAAGSASLVISRAGASSIGEIAWWGVPSILIPITNSNGDHQRNNAFSYASTGAASVIEEKNLTPEIIRQEIDRITKDFSVAEEMRKATEKSRFPNAAKTIADELVSTAFTHEQ